MLNLLGGLNGRQDPDWAPMSRRSFLKIGGMAAGGLTLSNLLSLEAQAKTGSPIRPSSTSSCPAVPRTWTCSI